MALHENFRKSLCARRAEKFNTTIEVQEKIVLNNKKQSNAFRKINRILGTKTRPTLTTVEYTPTGSEFPVTCYSKLDIERACSDEGRRRFTQASHTPFMTGSLLHDVGYNATQSTVDLILTGSYHPASDVDPYTCALLSQLKMPPAVGRSSPLTGYVTTSEHILGWSKMRSTIACSPFGPLFADNIAGCSDVRVADIDSAIAAIPVLTGYSPLAWKKAIDVMIPKKSTSVHVTKLRIIVLFHLVYNMINKHVGRIAVRRAELLHLIPAEIYGSRPGYRANICALNKVLTYDVLRQRRFLGALCSNDALSCYYRILHAIASISLQRMGVSAETCQMMFGTLQDIEHYVATAYGISDQGYGAVEIPLQGIGQGNGAGPSIWLLITIPLINMLRDGGYGFRSTTPITGSAYRFVCYTFVDDTDTVHSTSDATVKYPQLVQEMQCAINTWEGGLRATGGALSHDKSYWYLMSMQWHHGRQKWTYQSVRDTPASLSILGDSANLRRPLTRHECSHAEETLGLWIAPDANQKAQVLALQTKLSLWSDRIRTRQLPQSLAWLSITSGISMALKYPLAATNLSKADCKKITQPLLDVALPAMGLPRRMPHALVFAPKEFLGYGIFDIWVQQGIDQISVCLDYGHRKRDDITGNLLRDVSESLRIELGMPKSPLSYDYKTWHLCLTHTKLHVLWQFCSESGIQLHDGRVDTPVLRLSDHFLMEIFSTTPRISPKELAILNHCRLFLRVKLLSDLCTGDGLSLRPDILDLRTPLDTRTSHLWPRTGVPNASRWRFWRDTLIKCFIPLQSRSHRLRTPLGPWCKPPPGWTWYLSPSQNQLYHLELNGQYAVYAQATTRHSTRQPTFLLTASWICTLPRDALPTTASQARGHVRHTGTSPIINPRDECSHVTGQGMAVSHPSSFPDLLLGISRGTAIAVTDGSFKDGLGTAAFAICPSLLCDPTASYTLVNCTPGCHDDIDAYRAELGGIFGILHTVHALCQSNSVLTGSVTIACDCLSAIHNITRQYDPNSGTSHHDLVSNIRFLIRTSPISWTFRHVRGHQDDHCTYGLLDRWGQLNVDMDTLSKAYWATLNRNRPNEQYLTPFPGQWSIWQGHY